MILTGVRMDVPDLLQAILDTKGLERRDTWREIADTGFDIVNNANWLQDYYLKKLYIKGAYQ